MSAPPESQPDNSAHSRFLYPSDPMLYFHAPSGSLFVGADESCYTEDYLSRVSDRAPGTRTGGIGQKTVKLEDLLEAFSKALRDTNQTDLDLIKGNNKNAFDRYAKAVRQNVERHVNDGPMQSTPVQQSGCTINLASIERHEPFGSVHDFTPLWKPPRREMQPGTKVNINAGGDYRSVLMNFPCSVSVMADEVDTGTRSRVAMTATREWLQKTADHALKPLRTHCHGELLTLRASRFLPGTKEEKAKLHKDTEASMSKLGGYLFGRQIVIGTAASELRVQKEIENPPTVATVDSDWSFQVPGSPKLRVDATALDGVDCLPENTIVIFESSLRGVPTSSGSF